MLLTYSSNESSVFGLQMYRTELPSLAATDGLALLDALITQDVDLCRIVVPGHATDMRC